MELYQATSGRLLFHLVVAASPDLTFLPFAIAASAFGVGSVAAVLGAFSAVTLATFVGLTLTATAVGYQMRGE